jgi:hypothetical protein
MPGVGRRRRAPHACCGYAAHPRRSARCASTSATTGRSNPRDTRSPIRCSHEARAGSAIETRSVEPFAEGSMKTVLVATDRSPTAACALEFAVALCRESGAHLEVRGTRRTARPRPSSRRRRRSSPPISWSSDRTGGTASSGPCWAACRRASRPRAASPDDRADPRVEGPPLRAGGHSPASRPRFSTRRCARTHSPAT